MKNKFPLLIISILILMGCASNEKEEAEQPEQKTDDAKKLFYEWLPLIRYENTVGISLSIRKEILKRRTITKYSNVRYPSPSMDEDDKKELEFILKDYL